MLKRRNFKRDYLNATRNMKDFLLSAKSREFFIFLFFFLIAGGFWLLQTLNNDYETEFSIPVRLKNVPNKNKKYVKKQLEQLDHNFLDYICYWNKKTYLNGLQDGINLILFALVGDSYGT